MEEVLTEEKTMDEKEGKKGFLEKLALSSPLIITVIGIGAFFTIIGMVFNLLLTPIKADIVTIEKRFEKGFDKLEVKVDRLETKVDKIEIKINSIETKLDHLLKKNL